MRHSIFTLWSVVLIGILPMVFSSCSFSENGNETSIELIPVKLTEDGNWSMMDRDGNIVYDGEFKNAPTSAMEGTFSVMEGDLYTLYKTGGKEPVALDGCEELKATGYMSEGVIPVVFPHERIQLRDKSGKKICELGPIEGKEVYRCAERFREGLLAFSILDGEEKWGFMDKNGKVVIKPTYDIANGFKDGVALCALKKSDSPYGNSYVVIDHKGKVLFEVEDDLRPHNGWRGFCDRRMVLSGPDVKYLVDKEGKKTKLPSKINYVDDFDGEYIIFKSKDGEYGVADINGEICIRPKYADIKFGIGNKFLASKPDKDETLVLNDKGEVVEELDYSSVESVPGFGYVAKEGKKYVLLGDDLKQKGTEDFYEIYDIRHTGEYITSDYFAPEDVVAEIMKKLRADGFGDYSYGESAAKIFAGKDVDGYISSPVTLDSYIQGFKYEIRCGGYFTESLSTWRDGGYVWKDGSKLDALVLAVEVPVDAKKETANKLRTALVAQGYEEDTEKYQESEDGSTWIAWYHGTPHSKSGQTYDVDVVMQYMENSPIAIQMRGKVATAKTTVEDSSVVADEIIG